MVNRFTQIAASICIFTCASTISSAEDLLENADIAYGEYLAGECVTCHSVDGADRGIPSIIGVDAEGFAYMMHAYKNKELDNKVMQLVAGRLDDEQIASLATYFASLPEK